MRRVKKTRAKAGYGIKRLRSHHCFGHFFESCDLNLNERICQEINVEIAVEQCRASDLKAYLGWRHLSLVLFESECFECLRTFF